MTVERRRRATRTRQLERDVGPTAERLALVLDTSEAGMYGIDADGHFTFVNRSAATAFGYDAAELIGVRAHDLVHDHRSDGTRYAWEECPSYVALQRGEVVRSDAELFWRRDGTPLPAEFAAHPLSVDGVVTGAVVSFTEITRRNGLSRALLGDAVDGVSLNAVRSRRILDVSDSFCTLTGYGRAELVGRTSVEVGLVLEDAVHLAATRSADARVEGLYEARLRRKDGSTRWVQFSHRMLGEELVLTIVRDVTQRHELEEQLRRQAAELAAARDEAVAANRAKSEFLSRMSHELRTPLNAILGFSQLLELEQLTAEQAESVDYIARGGRHLLALINEVLDISRIEAGTMTISPEPVAVGELVTELAALIHPLADGRKVAIEAGAAACDSYVLADRQRLKQVLLNLLSNGVKYNREGGTIAIACRTVDDDRLRITVGDTGYGIPPQNLDRLFRPFERLGAEGGEVEGTGMGLALSKGLIEAMGGTIGVETAVDVGSTFWVELALAEGPLERHDREGARRRGSGRSRLRIVHVEDNAANLRLVEKILARQEGHEVIPAFQGRLGLELARERRPDLVLLDVHLPDVPGLEILRELRRRPETRELPVVVLSADASKSQRARFLDAGATAYLTKPLDISELLEFVEQLPHRGPEEG